MTERQRRKELWKKAVRRVQQMLLGIMEQVVPGPCSEQTALRKCSLPAKGERHSVPAGNHIYNELPPFSVVRGQTQVPISLLS